MNRKDLRERTEALAGLVGSAKSEKINPTIMNVLLEDVLNDYFRRTRSLKSFIHSKISNGQFEYKLPSDVFVVDRVKVESITYFQGNFPVIVDSVEIADDINQVQDP